MGDLRNKVSDGERHVLYELIHLGLHPSVQYPIDRMHVDFAFPEYKLAFEINGSSHRTEEAQIKDSNRIYFMNTNGWKLYVFTENEAVNNPLNVAAKIKRALENRKEENKDKAPVETIKAKSFAQRVIDGIEDADASKFMTAIKKSFEKPTKNFNLYYVDKTGKVTNTRTPGKYYCNMCRRPIPRQGNCFWCNKKLKRQRNSR